MIEKNEFKKNLKEYVHSLGTGSSGITIDTDLFKDNILDSLKILDLIAFVESQLEIEMTDEDITLDKFRTIKKIVDNFYKK